MVKLLADSAAALPSLYLARWSIDDQVYPPDNSPGGDNDDVAHDVLMTMITLIIIMMNMVSMMTMMIMMIQ